MYRLLSCKISRALKMEKVGGEMRRKGKKWAGPGFVALPWLLLENCLLYPDCGIEIVNLHLLTYLSMDIFHNYNCYRFPKR